MTHEVLNQPPPLDGYNLFTADRALGEALRARGRGLGRGARARALGAIAGGEALDWGVQANAYPPVLRTHDRYGHRIDEVEFHPAWHELMRRRGRARAARAARGASRGRARTSRAPRSSSSSSQVEAGHGCPISMTYAAVPALRAQPDARRRVGAAPHVDRRTTRACGPRREKTRRALRHGDDREAGRLRRARQHHARARRSAPAGPAREYELTGHKWFCSAPMCDAFLVLAQAERGLSCFLLPRWRPDGTRNALPHPAAEGQARQPLERLERDRVRRRLGAAGRRGGPRRRDDHRDGEPHAARLRDRRGRDACGRRVAQATHHARAPRAPSASGSSSSR